MEVVSSRETSGEVDLWNGTARIITPHAQLAMPPSGFPPRMSENSRKSDEMEKRQNHRVLDVPEILDLILLHLWNTGPNRPTLLWAQHHNKLPLLRSPLVSSACVNRFWFLHATRWNWHSTRLDVLLRTRDPDRRRWYASLVHELHIKSDEDVDEDLPPLSYPRLHKVIVEQCDDGLGSYPLDNKPDMQLWLARLAVPLLSDQLTTLVLSAFSAFPKSFWLAMTVGSTRYVTLRG